MSVTAGIILAGRHNDGAFSEYSDAAAEALVPVAGRPMIDYVLDALADARGIDSVAVVAPPALEPAAAQRGALHVEAGATLTENLRRGLEAVPAGEELLFVTGDTPMLTAEVIDEFLAMCRREEGQFFYPIVAREVYERQYPGSRRTFARLKDGTFTGGNMFLVHREAVAPALALVERLFAVRKSPVGLARVIGLGFLVRLLLGRLTLAKLEKRVSELVTSKGRAMVVPFPEVALDVDGPDDLSFVEALIHGVP